MSYLHKYNYDDVFLRSISIGLLNLMSENIIIWNRIKDDQLVEIPIPFSYHAGSGDERFMQDIFLAEVIDGCVGKRTVEMNIDKIPRGWIKLDNCTINVATFTNRFVRGEYTVETDDNELITYVAPIIVIPLDLIYTCQIEFDTQIDVLKGVQKLIETFYKVNTFRVLYNGMVIQVSASFPEDAEIEKTYEFSFGDDTKPLLNFSVAVETYFPVVDHTKRMVKSNNIKSISVNLQPGTVSFPSYEAPKGTELYISKTFMAFDESIKEKEQQITSSAKELYPEPVSQNSEFDPGEPGDTPSTPLKTDRNEDGSIGIVGTPGYSDSYGNSYYDLNNIQEENADIIAKQSKASIDNEELPNVDNNLNKLDSFGHSNNQLPSE